MVEMVRIHDLIDDKPIIMGISSLVASSNFQVHNLTTYSSLLRARAISYATFKRHCTYPEDLNLDLEVMWNQIRVKQEYSKKYTTSENWEARYSNAEVYKNYERLMIRFLCHREWWKLMNVGPMKIFKIRLFDQFDEFTVQLLPNL